MIQSISALNPEGELLEIDLVGSTALDNYIVVSMEGLGSPDAIINAKGGPNFDGERVNSTRTDSRFINITIAVQGYPLSEEVNRRNLYRFFPTKKQILFGVQTDTRDYVIDAYVEKNTVNMFATIENAEITLKCTKVWFRDPTPRNVIFSGTNPLFTFPFSNESLTTPLLIFGEELSYVSRDFEYAGDIETGLVLRLHATGSVSGTAYIYNPPYNESILIDLDVVASVLGSSLGLGDDIVIDTRIASKSATAIRSGVPYNVLHALNRNPDWIYFHPGGNTIVYDVDTGIDNLQLILEWNELFRGI